MDMTTFTVMKTTLQEESCIPTYAVQAFQKAFTEAYAQQAEMVYVEHAQLIKKMPDGHTVVIKDLSDAYVAPQLKRAVLKRRKSVASLV
ncbi:hypothetical protein [Acinetobacter shaoyimingii]|nr:hypothetical protein [Acinetobacter shaoyimingii]